MFPGSRRFHSGIQGQEIRLEGDLVDHGDDVSDLLAVLVDLLHRLDGFACDRAAFVGRIAGRNRQLIRLLGVVRVLLHRGSDLLHRGRSLLQRGGLLAGPLREILVTLDDFFRPRRHALRRFAHGGEGLPQFGYRAVEADLDLLEIAYTGVRELVCQIPLCQVPQHPLRLQHELFYLRRLFHFLRHLRLDLRAHRVERLRQDANFVL